MIKLIAIDDFSPWLSKRRTHKAGYLIAADSTIARSGVLYYSRKAIGAPGNPSELVAVYRPPGEVAKIINDYADVPLTVQHPDGGRVLPETVKGLAVGHVGSNARIESLDNGEVAVKADVVIQDGEAISLVDSNALQQLSAGYLARYEHNPGTSPDGTPYEFVQRDLECNHCALVRKGRCGDACKVSDEKEESIVAKFTTGASASIMRTPQETHRMMVKIAIDGIEQEVPAAVAKAMQELQAAADAAPQPKKITSDMDGADYEKAKKEEEEEAEKKKAEDECGTKPAATDAAPKFFPINVDGQKMVVDQAGLQYITKLQGEPKKPVVDGMEAVKLASVANKILGDTFDMVTCDSIESVKKAIVKKVLPTVADEAMVAADSLETLYTTAVGMHAQNHNAYSRDLSIMSGSPKVAADGTESTPSPFSGLMQFTTGGNRQQQNVIAPRPINIMTKESK